MSKCADVPKYVHKYALGWIFQKVIILFLHEMIKQVFFPIGKCILFSFCDVFSIILGAGLKVSEVAMIYKFIAFIRLLARSEAESSLELGL